MPSAASLDAYCCTASANVSTLYPHLHQSSQHHHQQTYRPDEMYTYRGTGQHNQAPTNLWLSGVMVYIQYIYIDSMMSDTSLTLIQACSCVCVCVGRVLSEFLCVCVWESVLRVVAQMRIESKAIPFRTPRYIKHVRTTHNPPANNFPAQTFPRGFARPGRQGPANNVSAAGPANV